MAPEIRVAILDDHQSIVDGYIYRLNSTPAIKVVGSASFGEDLEPLLTNHPADVLLLDIHVPTSSNNQNPFPVLHVIPKILEIFPNLSVLVISMLVQQTLIESLIDAGVSGYIFKDDSASIQQLSQIVTMVANGGIYFSQKAYLKLNRTAAKQKDNTMTARQLEVLSLCAAYPDYSTSELAQHLGIAPSTLRNLLSGAYLRLGVRTRVAAVAKIQQLGLIPSITRIPNK